MNETLDEVWPVDPPICEILTSYLTSWISYSSLDWVVLLVFVLSFCFRLNLSCQLDCAY